MRTTQFDATKLLALFKRRKIATMDEMKTALGTAADRTVFRKLLEFPYRSSYSDRGKFYTLDALAEFPELQYLELIDTSVTEGGVAKLREALPNCEIHWDEAGGGVAQ